MNLQRNPKIHELKNIKYLNRSQLNNFIGLRHYKNQLQVKKHQASQVNNNKSSSSSASTSGVTPTSTPTSTSANSQKNNNTNLTTTTISPSNSSSTTQLKTTNSTTISTNPTTTNKDVSTKNATSNNATSNNATANTKSNTTSNNATANTTANTPSNSSSSSTQKNSTTTANNSNNSNSSNNKTTSTQASITPPIDPIPIAIISVIVILIITLIILIYILCKKYNIRKKYNETPENFVQSPSLTMNQKRNLEKKKFQLLYTNKNQLIIEQQTSYGGKVYELTFKNTQKQFAMANWQKILRTDCYFQIEIDTLSSEVQFGYVHKKYIQQFKKGQQNHIGKIGVSLNSYGSLKVHGEIRYQFKWNLQYGDVVGLGITRFQKVNRIWITKNGILQNPPLTQQIQKWINNESLSNQHKQAFNEFNKNFKSQTINKRMQPQLIKKKITLPEGESFDYYALISSYCLVDYGKERGQKKDQWFEAEKQKNVKSTVVRFNVGGKLFRIRDNNLKTGLLADSYEKNQFCQLFPCC